MQDRVWWSYSDPETGDIWVAKSDKNFIRWEERQRLLFVPSGSTNPSVIFDSQGRYIIAVEFLPAGSDQKEIWLYEPPYSGTGIRQITQGQYPVLAKDIHGEVFLFYQTADMSQILYRKSSDNFNIDYPFESSEDEKLQPRGFRVVTKQISSIHQRYAHLMFYQEGEGELPLYKMTRPIDLVKIKQTAPLYTNFGQPSLEWEVIKYVDLLAKAGGLHTSFGELGLEWEDMRTGMQVLVYSGKQFRYEQLHLLIHQYPSGTQREALVWLDKGVSIDQDVVVDVYASGTGLPRNVRPGISLRTGGSSGKETMYVGYYRYPNSPSYLQIGKYVNGTFTSLATDQNITIKEDTWYTYRMQAIGNNIRFKLWEKGNPEPSEWNLEAVDSSISSGYAGVFEFNNLPAMWSNFYLNGEKANWETSDGGIPDGWSLQFGTASRWTTETESMAVGFDYLVVPNATVQLGDQYDTTNQDGMAEFFDLDANQLYDYEISHPDFEGISKGTLLIPEEERDFIPVRIYDNPWDGTLKAGGVVPNLGQVSTLWHQVEFEEIKARAGVKTNASLQSILWVEVESE